MLKSAPHLSLPYSRAFCGSPLPSILDPGFHSLLPSQNNLISKVPRGALSRQTHLRELYLQHNQLTDSGLDATTFRWGLGQNGMGYNLMVAIEAATLCPPPLYHSYPMVSTYCAPGSAQPLVTQHHSCHMQIWTQNSVLILPASNPQARTCLDHPKFTSHPDLPTHHPNVGISSLHLSVPLISPPAPPLNIHLVPNAGCPE